MNAAMNTTMNTVMNAHTLAQQVALVTGASSGIGRAIAVEMADAGAAVVVNYRSQPDAAKEVVQHITRAGGQAIAVKADVGSEPEVERLFEQAIEAFGRVDILVANSGIQRDAAIGEMTLEQWNEVIATNLTGQFLCARAAVRQFRRQAGDGGRNQGRDEGRDDVRDEGRSRALGKIIHISSVHQLIPWAGHANYAASKGGIDLFMRSLAQEVAQEGIRVNAIAPGAIATAINRASVEDEAARKKMLSLIPYGRIGAPEDVAAAALWLASDASDYVVGTTLFIDGGMSLYPEFRDGG
jgi:glucose 1-dehydrogenase